MHTTGKGSFEIKYTYIQGSLLWIEFHVPGHSEKEKQNRKIQVCSKFVKFVLTVFLDNCVLVQHNVNTSLTYAKQIRFI